MRVAIDVAQTCVARAGVGWHADALARSLVSEIGAEQSILYHHFGDWLNACTINGTTIEGVASPFRGMERPEAFQLWQSIQRNEVAPPDNPDIVHSNSFMAPKIYGAKLVYTVHDLCFWTHPEYTSEANRCLCQRQMLQALNHADAFIFVSEQSRSDFETMLPDWLSSENKLWQVIPSTARTKSPLKREIDTRFEDPMAPWLHVGTIEPRKGIDRLLDTYTSYHSCSRQPRPLLMVGLYGWLSEQLHERISVLGRSLPIHYLGHVDDDDLNALYKRAFGLLCASRYEGFCLPVAEAAASGLPVVSSEVPSLSVLSNAHHFYSGMSFDNALNKMLELESDPVLYKSVCEKTLLMGQKRNFADVAKDVIRFYHSILSS